MPGRAAEYTYGGDGYTQTYNAKKLGSPRDWRTVTIAGEPNTPCAFRGVASTAGVDAAVSARGGGGATSDAAQFGCTPAPP